VDALHERHREFVQVYLSNGYNATKAADAVGYSAPAVAGCRMMRRADIKRAIADLRIPDLERVIATVAEVRENLTTIALDPTVKPSDRTAASALLLKTFGALGPDVLLDARTQTVVYQIGEGASVDLLDALDVLRRMGEGEAVDPAEAQAALQNYLASGANKALTPGD